MADGKDVAILPEPNKRVDHGSGHHAVVDDQDQAQDHEEITNDTEEEEDEEGDPEQMEPGYQSERQWTRHRRRLQQMIMIEYTLPENGQRFAIGDSALQTLGANMHWVVPPHLKCPIIAETKQESFRGIRFHVISVPDRERRSYFHRKRNWTAIGARAQMRIYTIRRLYEPERAFYSELFLSVYPPEYDYVNPIHIPHHKEHSRCSNRMIACTIMMKIAIVAAAVYAVQQGLPLSDYFYPLRSWTA